jgi:hypothetical protein
VLTAPSRTVAACTFAKNEEPDNGAPYRLTSVNLIWLDSRFHKEYRYGLIISPFSTDKKQQASSGAHRPFPIGMTRKHKFLATVDTGKSLKSVVGHLSAIGTFGLNDDKHDLKS